VKKVVPVPTKKAAPKKKAAPAKKVAAPVKKATPVKKAAPAPAKKVAPKAPAAPKMLRTKPANPKRGDTYKDADGIVRRHDGTKWRIIG